MLSFSKNGGDDQTARTTKAEAENTATNFRGVQRYTLGLKLRMMQILAEKPLATTQEVFEVPTTQDVADDSCRTQSRPVPLLLPAPLPPPPLSAAAAADTALPPPRPTRLPRCGPDVSGRTATRRDWRRKRSHLCARKRLPRGQRHCCPPVLGRGHQLLRQPGQPRPLRSAALAVEDAAVAPAEPESCRQAHCATRGVRTRR